MIQCVMKSLWAAIYLYVPKSIEGSISVIPNLSIVNIKVFLYRPLRLKCRILATTLF